MAERGACILGIKTLTRAVAESGAIFIDTAVFSYVLAEHPRYIDAAAQVVRAVEAQTTTGITSVVTLIELLTLPEQRGDAEASRAYEIYLRNFPNLTIRSVDFEVARAAARLRGRFRLKTLDAVQIATAIVSRANLIVTNDKQWRGKTEGVHVLLLDEAV